MELQGTTIKVNTVLFESNDNEVLIKGNVKAGVMNYDTDLIISHSQLNMIFNSLQRQNENISVNDYLQSEKMYDGETLYSADFSSLLSNIVLLNDIEGSQPLKQIRA
jgi:hypothetical protein